MAYAIKDGLEAGGLKVDLKKAQEATEDDFYGYDLVCAVRPRLSGNRLNQLLIC